MVWGDELVDPAGSRWTQRCAGYALWSRRHLVSDVLTFVFGTSAPIAAAGGLFLVTDGWSLLFLVVSAAGYGTRMVISRGTRALVDPSDRVLPVLKAARDSVARLEALHKASARRRGVKQPNEPVRWVGEVLPAARSALQEVEARAAQESRLESKVSTALQPHSVPYRFANPAERLARFTPEIDPSGSLARRERRRAELEASIRELTEALTTTATLAEDLTDDTDAFAGGRSAERLREHLQSLRQANALLAECAAALHALTRPDDTLELRSGWRPGMIQ